MYTIHLRCKGYIFPVSDAVLFSSQNMCKSSCSPRHCGVVDGGGWFIDVVMVVVVVAKSLLFLLPSLPDVVSV